MNNNNLCKQHSGFDERIKDLEDDVKELWVKWNGLNKIVIATFISVIILLVRTFVFK